MNTLKRFNEIFLDIFRDIIHEHPSNSSIKLYKTSLKTMLFLNKKLIYNIFHIQIPKYKESILAKDEAFLLENNYSDLKSPNEKIFLQIVSNLKNSWIDLTPKTKELIWYHLHILLLLDEQLQII